MPIDRIIAEVSHFFPVDRIIAKVSQCPLSQDLMFETTGAMTTPRPSIG